MKREAITVENDIGNRMFGIVHVPENHPSPKITGVVLLNPGIKYRVAPNRLSVKIADRLCQSGYYVLRFDPAGVGDSEGELRDGIPVRDLWAEIQEGLFVSDTHYAINSFTTTYPIERVVLAGNCGGAISALLASVENSSVSGLCLIDVPINLRDSSVTFAEKAVEGGEKSNWYFSQYLKRILSIKAWYRFITLQTNYRALGKTVSSQFRSLTARHLSNTDLNLEIDRLCEERVLNRKFYDAFDKFHDTGGAILFLLAESDAGTEMFDRYFMPTLNFDGDGVQVRIEKISNANHIYNAIESQTALMDTIDEWTRKLFS